jgi:hypothetical protein
VSADDWPRNFERDHGRPPRVLHVGNVGNNAYLNAYFLRAAGVECDVFDANTSALSTPEWEGHTRPPWYLQASLPEVVAHLRSPDGPRAVPLRARPPSNLSRVVLRGRRAAGEARRRLRPVHPTRDESSLLARFADVFPDRTDRLTLADMRLFGGLELWRSLFDGYDVVQCYATYPLHALLAGARPYVAYEHGTLRTFVLEDDPLSRMTALAYRESDHTFVTNGDCLPYAQRIGIPRFSAMIHPLDVAQHERDRREEAQAIRRRLRADVLLFCPMRHDWAIKGTDVHLRALPELIARLDGHVVLALCRWGGQVSEAERLLRTLGIAEHAVWLELMPRESFIAHLHAADVVLDQMTLPHFDATVPQSLAAGTPVVMSYRPESTAWMISEPAPILPAFDESGVVSAVTTALEPNWRREFRERATRWIHAHHHPSLLVAEHLRVYERLIESKQAAHTIANVDA